MGHRDRPKTPRSKGDSCHPLLHVLGETRVGEGDDWNPRLRRQGNDGEEIWENLIRENKEFFLVLGGRILHDGLGRLTSTGAHHQTVHQVLANYQMKEQGGNARLRIITFLPSAGKIVFNT